MVEDARFEDAREAPINVGALDAEDIGIISALVQDSVFPSSEMQWRPKERRFALLLNRFRWEDQGVAHHGAERVQALLVFDNVVKVASQGIARDDDDTVMSLLALEWLPSEAPGGVIELKLAGDGGIRLHVEALEIRLRDVTRPYKAPSRKTPDHEV